MPAKFLSVLTVLIKLYNSSLENQSYARVELPQMLGVNVLMFFPMVILRLAILANIHSLEALDIHLSQFQMYPCLVHTHQLFVFGPYQLQVELTGWFSIQSCIIAMLQFQT